MILAKINIEKDKITKDQLSAGSSPERRNHFLNLLSNQCTWVLMNLYRKVTVSLVVGMGITFLSGMLLYVQFGRDIEYGFPLVWRSYTWEPTKPQTFINLPYFLVDTGFWMLLTFFVLSLIEMLMIRRQS